MYLRNVIRRAVSGVLTASMILSLFSSGGFAMAADESYISSQPSRVAAVSAREWAQRVSKDSGSGTVAMPLQLDRASIGFSSESDEAVEVTAYMTDIRYLGLLTLEEYASFFPVGLDLERAEYLTSSLRESIAAMSEADRASHRREAERKLDVENQFLWDNVAGEDGEKIENLAFEPVAYTIYEATENTAPMIACTAKVTWIGERPVQYIDAPSSSAGLSADDLQNLMEQSGEGAGNKSIADESPEIQEFLRQLYNDGLSQENSDYDLSIFGDQDRKSVV